MNNQNASLAHDTDSLAEAPGEEIKHRRSARREAGPSSLKMAKNLSGQLPKATQDGRCNETRMRVAADDAGLHSPSGFGSGEVGFRGVIHHSRHVVKNPHNS